MDQILSGLSLPTVLPSSGFLLLAWVVVYAFIKGHIRTAREVEAAREETKNWQQAYLGEHKLNVELSNQNSRLLTAADLGAHAFSQLPEARGAADV